LGLLEPDWHVKLFEGLLHSSLIRAQKLELVLRHLIMGLVRKDVI